LFKGDKYLKSYAVRDELKKNRGVPFLQRREKLS